jgi:hypothetical protein
LFGKSVRNRENYPIFPNPIFHNELRNFEKSAPIPINTSFWTLYFAPFQPPEKAAEFLSDFESRTELSVEFFYCFECFSGLPLPKFCANEFEFVYFIRSSLESLGNSLHFWTSKIFGVSEPRVNQAGATSEAISLAIPEFKVGFFSNSIFTLMDESNLIRTVDFHGAGRYWRLSATIDIFLCLDNYFIVIDLGASKMIYSDGDFFRDVTFDFSIREITVGPDSIAVWTGEHEIVVMQFPAVVARIPLKTHMVRCLCSSLRFDRVVVGTITNQLFIYSISDAKFVEAVDLGGQIAEKLLITKGFGFIVVCFVEKLAAYTINGVAAGEMALEQAVDEWSTFQNQHGFDFLLVADRNGAISVVEVVNLKQTHAVFQCHTRIGVLEYDSVKRRFAVATFDGSGYFVPYDPPETVPSFQ